jgi:predicted permease
MNSDLRYAWRAIWKSPATTLGAMLALALGIGATTTIFALLNAVLLRPLPYPDADRLVELWGTVQREQVERRGTSYPDYFDWRDRTRSFDAMASWTSANAILYGSGEPVQLPSEIVDGPYFELLGARAIEGRLFQPSDHRPDATPVAVITERLWEQRFNRSRDAIGRSIRLNARVFTIVGVTAAGFAGRSDAAQLWTPASTTLPPNALAARGSRGFAPLARLAPGVTLAAAQADLSAVCAQLEQQFPDTNERRSAQVSPLAAEIFQGVRPAVSLLFGVVALVLLIACANVASLLLARSEVRRREVSLRRALGAETRQLARVLIAESALLVILGGALGLLIAQWMGDALLTLSPVQLPSFAVPATDWRTLLFTSIIGVITTVGIGLTPLVSIGRESLAHELREGAVASRGGARGSALRFIVIGEVAIAVALLVGAALLGRSFAALLDFDPGFDPRGVLSMRVQLPVPPAPPPGTTPAPLPPPAVGALTLLERLRSQPGVEQASLTTSVPLADSGAIFYAAEGMPPVDATNRPRTYIQGITPGHFATLGIKFVEGRDFLPSEMGAQSTAVIVSETVARRFWPGESAIGRRVKQGDLTGKAPWSTIVGVVQEANLRGIPRNPTADPDWYVPFNDRARAFAVLLRTSAEPSSLAGPTREVLRSAEPGIAIFRVQSLGELVDQQLAPARFLSWLTGAFATVALTLAVIGIYGMLSYWVRRRTAEIGIRAALGADRSQVLRLVVGQALTLAAIGIVIGAVLAAGLTRYVETQLFGVQAMDWMSFGGTALIMMIAATIASLAPAIRALRLDPVAALRSSA